MLLRRLMSIPLCPRRSSSVHRAFIKTLKSSHAAQIDQLARKERGNNLMQIGMIGLGKMGINMARRLLRGGHEVFAYNRTPDRIKEISGEGAKGAYSIEELVKMLKSPRLFWVMGPAGKPVDEIIGRLQPLLEHGDIIIDGGNSFYKDDIRHEEELKPYGIRNFHTVIPH